MEECGFPVIPRYLELQVYPNDFIDDAKVTHIWTQDNELSGRIAKASKINHVVNHFEDLIGSVDAVLLARDDAENHFYFAKPFLEAGIPIYIDKPLALSLFEAQKLLDLQRYPGQIFSCSALRYADELMPDTSRLNDIGIIKTIIGCSPKDWDKYAVHVIEPALRFLSDCDDVTKTSVWEVDQRKSLHLYFASGIDVLVSTYGDCSFPIFFKIVGTTGCIDLQFNDSFRCFKKALQCFLASIREQKNPISSHSMLRVVSLIEAGRTIG